MNKYFKPLLLGLALLGASTAGCTTKPTVPEKPTIPEIFKEQLTRFLEEGSKANAMTEQGVTYSQLQEQVADVKGAYDLAFATWPEDFSPESRQSFERALEAWSLALDLWALDIGDKDNPVEPNINGYRRYVDFAGDLLVVDTHPSSYIVEEYAGKKFIAFQENISILLTIAAQGFDEGRTQVLQDLTQGTGSSLVLPPNPSLERTGDAAAKARENNNQGFKCAS